MLASRIRRAISCAYWAPKSTTRTGRACSGVVGGSARSATGASTRSSSWAWVTSLVTTSAAAGSLTAERLPARGREPSLDLGDEAPLGPERQQWHEPGQHDADHLGQAPAHLEAEVGDGDHVDEIDHPVDRAPHG